MLLEPSSIAAVVTADGRRQHKGYGRERGEDAEGHLSHQHLPVPVLPRESRPMEDQNEDGRCAKAHEGDTSRGELVANQEEGGQGETQGMKEWQEEPDGIAPGTEKAIQSPVSPSERVHSPLSALSRGWADCSRSGSARAPRG